MKRAAQWAAARMMESAGFRWELRRNGDLKVGLWRKDLGKARTGKGSVTRVSKTKKRLVFLPGMGDAAFSWLGIFSTLTPLIRKEHDELVFMDFPGFLGALAREKPIDSMDQLLKQVHDVLDTLQPKTLIGHSLGGWLAALYAEDCGEGRRPGNPSPPEHLILMNPGGGISGESQVAEFRRFAEELFDTSPDPGMSWRKLIFDKEPFWFPVFADDIRHFITRAETRAFIRSFEHRHFVIDRLASIRGDVDLVWSERDGLFPAAGAQAWLLPLSTRLGQHSQLLVLRAIGHSPHVESPMKTAAVLAHCLRARRGDAVASLSRVTRRWWRKVEPSPALPEPSAQVTEST